MRQSRLADDSNPATGMQAIGGRLNPDERSHLYWTRRLVKRARGCELSVASGSGIGEGRLQSEAKYYPLAAV